MRYREFDVTAPEYQPMAYFSSDVDEDPAAWLSNIHGARAVGRFQQPGQQAAGGRLPAAGLAHQRQRLAAVDVEVEPIDGLDRADGAAQEPGLDREVLLQPARGHQHVAAGLARADFRGSPLEVVVGSVMLVVALSERRLDVVLRDGLALLGRQVTGDHVLTACPLVLRPLGLAAAVVAVRRKNAHRGWNGQPDGDVDEAGWVARDRQQPVGAFPVPQGRRLQQAPGVGVLRPVEDVLRAALLDRATGVHHEDVVGQLGHHAEVVRDHHDRGVELLLAGP